MVSLLISDDRSTAVTAKLAELRQPTIVSDLVAAEVFSVLASMRRNRTLSADDLALAVRTYEEFSDGSSVQLDAADGRIAAQFTIRDDLGLRAADAIHLAICRRLGATLLTYDHRQADAAKSLGIKLA